MIQRKHKNGIKRGGTAIPLESNIFMLNGKSHKNGGIDIDKTVEAQGGEIMRRFGPDNMQILSKENNFIHGNPVKNYLSGMSFDDAFRLQQIDNVLQGRKSSVNAKYGIETEYDRIKRTMAKNGTNVFRGEVRSTSPAKKVFKTTKRVVGRSANTLINTANFVYGLPDKILGRDKFKSNATYDNGPMDVPFQIYNRLASNIKDDDYRSLATALPLIIPGKGMRQARKGAAGTGGARTTRAKKTSTAQTTLNFTPDYQSMTPTDLAAGRARVKTKGEIRHSSSHRPVIKDGKTVYETTAENAKQSTIAAKGTAHRMSNHTLLDLLGGVSEHSAKREAVAAINARRKIILAAGEKRKSRPGGVNANVGSEEVGSNGYLIDRRHVTDNPNLHLTEDAANLRQINKVKNKQEVAKYNKEAKGIRETSASIERGLAQEPYLLSGTTSRHHGRVIRNRFGIVKDVKFGPRTYGFKKSVTDPKTGKTYSISDIERHYDTGIAEHPFSGKTTYWTLPENVSFENGTIVTRDINTRHSASAWRKNRPYTGNKKNVKSVNNTTERTTRTTNNTASDNNTQSKSSSKWVKYGKRTGYGIAGILGTAGIINAFRPRNQHSGFTNNDAYGVDESLSGRFVYADPDERDTDTIGRIGNAMHHDSIIGEIYDANGDTVKLNQITDTTRQDSARRKKKYGGNSSSLRAVGTNRNRAIYGLPLISTNNAAAARKRIGLTTPDVNVDHTNGTGNTNPIVIDDNFYVSTLPQSTTTPSIRTTIPKATPVSVNGNPTLINNNPGSTTTKNNNTSLNLLNGFNKFDTISSIINGGLAIATAAHNNFGAINKEKDLPTPIIPNTPKLRTRYNINPQLTENRETFSKLMNDVRTNSANSLGLRNSLGGYLNSLSLANNKLYADKENREINLINEDSKLRYTHNNNVANTINNHRNNLIAQYNDRLTRKAENINALATNLSAISNKLLDNTQQRGKFKLDYLATLAPYVGIISGNNKKKSNILYNRIINGINLL